MTRFLLLLLCSPALCLPLDEYPMYLTITTDPSLLSPILPSLLGRYTQHSIHNGRPVWVNTMGLTHYYLFATNSSLWLVGPEVGKEEGWLLSSRPTSNTNPMVPMSGWRVSSDSGNSVSPGAWWVTEPNVKVEGMSLPSCLTFSMIPMTEPVAPLPVAVLGQYTRQTRKYNGLPVWMNRRGEQDMYYLFSTNSSLWLVGPEVGKEDGWLLSSRPSASIPETGWQVSTDSGDSVSPGAWWVSEPNLRVEGPCPPPPPPQHHNTTVTITSVNPHELQRTTARTLQLAIDNLPNLPGNYLCAFSALGKVLMTNATRTNTGVACTTPRNDLLPIIPYGESHFTSKLSVRMESGPDFVTTNFTFFDCNTYSSCTTCVSSSFPCDWCVDYHHCVHDTAENCRNDILVTGVNRIGPSIRSGPAFCPRITTTTGNGSSPAPEILVSSGLQKSIRVKVDHIAQFIIQTRFVCQFNIEGRVTSVNAQLLNDTIYCDEMEFTYTSRSPNITATFAVIWGQSKPLDNPDNIHVLIYRCKEMANDCGMCLSLNEKYECGWCQVTERCEVQAQCGPDNHVSWLNRDETCPVTRNTGEPCCSRIKLKATGSVTKDTDFPGVYEYEAMEFGRFAYKKNSVDNVITNSCGESSELVGYRFVSHFNVCNGSQISFTEGFTGSCITGPTAFSVRHYSLDEREWMLDPTVTVVCVD